MNKISESIFSGKTTTIPMADICYIRKHWYQGDEISDKTIKGYNVIMKGTTYDNEADTWANQAYLGVKEGKALLKAWCYYRYEIEGGEEAFKSPSDKEVKDE